jgi:hypothetical protein
MPDPHLTTIALARLFQSRADLTRSAAIRAPTERGRAILLTESSTWAAAAKILCATLLTNPPPGR